MGVGDLNAVIPHAAADENDIQPPTNSGGIWTEIAHVCLECSVSVSLRWKPALPMSVKPRVEMGVSYEIFEMTNILVLNLFISGIIK